MKKTPKTCDWWKEKQLKTRNNGLNILFWVTLPESKSFVRPCKFENKIPAEAFSSSKTNLFAELFVITTPTSSDEQNESPNARLTMWKENGSNLIVTCILSFEKLTGMLLPSVVAEKGFGKWSSFLCETFFTWKETSLEIFPINARQPFPFSVFLFRSN